MNSIFKIYGIKEIHIITKMRLSGHIYVLFNKLHMYGLKILSLSSRRLLAHNGVKGRNLRRL